jgi:hypothetical protein
MDLDDGNPCTVDSCDPVTGVTHVPLPAGTSCSDGDVCNGEESCDSGGACRPGAPPAIDDGNPCTKDLCDPVLGVSHVQVPEGASCSDANACNGEERCDAFAKCLAGTTPLVDDGNPCTVDGCDPATGPTHRPAAAGVSCSDGNVCNGEEACDGEGHCQAGVEPGVDDGDPCTVDACSPETGFTHEYVMDESCTATPFGWVVHDAGRPSPRDGAGVVFDPARGELLILGGANAGMTLAETWRLDAASHRWDFLSGGPPGRAGAAVARHASGQVLVFGGIHREGMLHEVLADTWQFDPVQAKWTRHLPAGPPPRAYAATALDVDRGVVVMLGGVDASGQELGDLWEWDGEGWLEHATDQPPPARSHAAMAYDSLRKRIVMVGGGVSAGGALLPLGDCWELDTMTSLWQSCVGDALPPARLGHAMVYDPVRHRTVLTGGTGNAPEALSDCWEYDPDALGWDECEASGSVPARVGHGLAFDTVRQRTILFGGIAYSDSGRVTPAFDDWWEYQPSTGWVSLEPDAAPSASRFGVAHDPLRRVLVTLERRRPAYDILYDEEPFTWELDTATDLWTAKEPQEQSDGLPRSYEGTVFFDHASQRTRLHAETGVWDWDGVRWVSSCEGLPLLIGGAAYDVARDRLVIVGEGYAGYGMTTEWGELDLAACKYTRHNGTTTHRAHPSLAYDSTRSVTVLFGGRAGAVLYNDTLEYDGSAWTVRNAGLSDSPPALLQPAMAYDELRQRVVLFGGLDVADTPSDQTWEYDGSSGTWEQRFPAARPGPRFAASMTYDADRQRVVLLGGNRTASSAMPDADPWVWDGESWGRLGPQASPMARSGAAVARAYTGHVVLFGGVAGDGQRALLQDTWLWTGEWTLATPGATHQDAASYQAVSTWPGTLPPARAGHAFASSASGDLLMFGGQGDGGVLGDTWEWDARFRVWRSLPAKGGDPAPRVGAAMAGLLPEEHLLFGGTNADGVRLGDTHVHIGEWNRWSRVVVPDPPPPRSEHAMAFDQARNRIVLFGGRGANGASLGDTWEYERIPHGFRNKGTWVKVEPPISPPARFGHQLSYDSQRERVVLTGGVGQSPDELLSDTWEWDGTTWSLRMPIGRPEPRAGHVAFHDPDSSDLVLFGGMRFGHDGTAVATYGDTWVLRGADAPDHGPPRYPLGTTCSTGLYCESGFCVDGVCCDSACPGQCESCVEASRVGHCSPVVGEPRGNRPACGEPDPCTPTCDGVRTDTCAATHENSVCAAASCTDGLLFPETTCGASAACFRESTSCEPFGCAGTVCAAGCDAQTPCFPGYFCWSHATGRYCRQKVTVDLLTVTPPGPVPRGRGISIEALASAASPHLPPGVSDDILYRFRVYYESGPPSAECYGYQPTCWFFAWNAGHYRIRVEVKNAASPAAYDDAEEYILEVTP